VRTWKTRRGESIQLPAGNELAGQGQYKGKAQFMYRHNGLGKFWRVTRLTDGGNMVEEWTRGELEGLGYDLSCFTGCDDE